MAVWHRRLGLSTTALGVSGGLQSLTRLGGGQVCFSELQVSWTAVTQACLRGTGRAGPAGSSVPSRAAGQLHAFLFLGEQFLRAALGSVRLL